MNLIVKIWRQKDRTSKGELITYYISDITSDMSFLEMLDKLNQELIQRGDDPVARIICAAA